MLIIGLCEICSSAVVVLGGLCELLADGIDVFFVAHVAAGLRICRKQVWREPVTDISLASVLNEARLEKNVEGRR